MTSFQSLQLQDMFQRKQVLMKKLKFGIMNYLTMIEKYFPFWMWLSTKLLSRHYLKLKKKQNFKMLRSLKRNASEDKFRKMRNGFKKSSWKLLKTILKTSFYKMQEIKEQL